MPMSPERRLALLAWAERRNAILIEDDYDSDFRFQGRPIETLHGLDRSGRVIYVGSFSKVMLPALRLGFLVAPASLRRALLVAKLLTDWHTDLPAQAALARFIDEGLLARHIRKMRREYQARHECIRATLTRDFSAWLQLVPSVAGLHLSSTFRRGSRALERDIVARAKAAGVGLRGLSDFYVNRPVRPGLVFGYGGVPLSQIEDGLRRLQACLASAIRAPG